MPKTTKEYRMAFVELLVSGTTHFTCKVKHAGGRSPKLKVALEFRIPSEGSTMRFAQSGYVRKIERSFDYAARLHNCHTFVIDSDDVFIEANRSILRATFTALPKELRK